MKKLLNYINGEFKAPINDEWVDNYDPSHSVQLVSGRCPWPGRLPSPRQGIAACATRYLDI